MATTIKLKNSVTTTNAPSSLVQGEVAINITDKKVWVGNAATTPVQLLGDGGSASFTSIAFGAGTVSLPSITFTGDTNTGIYSPAADTIAFTEGGVESMRIDSSGNVGIGTNNPSQKVEINDATTAAEWNGLRVISAANPSGTSYTYINIEKSSGFGGAIAGYLQQGVGSGLAFFSNNGGTRSERMRVTSSGNLLVGKTTDSAGLIQISGSAASNKSDIAITNTDSSGRTYRIGDGVGGNNGFLNFFDATASAIRMTIDSNGNVGIGATNPSQVLEVSKSQNTETQIRVVNSNTGSSARSGFVLGNNSNAGAASLLLNSSNNTSNGGANSLNIYQGLSAAMVFYTDATERMRIDNTGNVSINQTAGKYTCDVTGGATSVANNGTVFYSNASGMLIVNNHTVGNISIYLCGGGVVTTVASAGSAVGTFAYDAGVAGYKFTNNTGSTATFGFFFVRTRTTA